MPHFSAFVAKVNKCLSTSVGKILLQFFLFPVDSFISFIEPKADVQTLHLFENC